MDTGFYSGQGSYDPNVRCEMLRELGYDGTYLTLWSDAAWNDVSHFAQLAHRHELSVAGIWSTLDVADEQASDNQRLLDSAHLFGGLTRLELAIENSANPDTRCDATNDHLAREMIGKLLDRIPNDVEICLYPHINMWLERFEDATELCSRFSDERVGLVFPAYHWYALDGDPVEDLLKRAGSRLRSVNVCGSRRTADQAAPTIEPLDEGELDNFALLGTLQRLGYDGMVGVQGYGMGGDSYSKLRRSLAAFHDMTKRLTTHPEWAVLRAPPQANSGQASRPRRREKPDVSATGPRLSVCELTTLTLPLDQELRLYRQAGIDGIGLMESKLPKERDDAEIAAAIEESGLEATICLPATLSVLPPPSGPGPREPDERIEALIAGVRRLARFKPACCFCVTGPQGDLGSGDARQIVVEGLRRVAAAAEEAGVPVGVEPLHSSMRDEWTLVCTIPETLELLEEVGAPNLGIGFDTWHLSDTPGVLDHIRAHADQIVGVHINDRRAETRGWHDRALPSEGTIDLASIFAALEDGGYKGWYDIEVLSDDGYEDSLSKLPPVELLQRSRDGFLRAWEGRR